jgi:hypothetical protein
MTRKRRRIEDGLQDFTNRTRVAFYDDDGIVAETWIELDYKAGRGAISVSKRAGISDLYLAGFVTILRDALQARVARDLGGADYWVEKARTPDTEQLELTDEAGRSVLGRPTTDDNDFHVPF